MCGYCRQARRKQVGKPRYIFKESTSNNEMQSSKHVKDLQINLKSIRLDFFWKNKNVCMFAGLVGVRGAGKQRAGSFSPLLFKHLPCRLGMNMLRSTWKTMKFVWFGT